MKQKSSALVSVLMTSYNSEQYIGAAIESVLGSTYTNYELIVVDDHSKDNSHAIALEFSQKHTQIVAVRNDKNLGDYQNRKKAASLARGKYIKYLDSDDIMYPHCLQVMVNAMEQFPEAGFGLSAKGDKTTPYPVCIPPSQIYMEHFNGYGHFDRSPGSAIIKKKVYDEVGGFSGKRHIGDTELWLKLAQKYSMVKFPPDLYWARTHELSESAIERRSNYEKIRKELEADYLNDKNCPVKKSDLNIKRISLKQAIGKKLKL